MLTHLAVLVLLLACMLPGCEKSPVEQASDRLLDSYRQGQGAADTETLSRINTSLQAYRAAGGKNPDNQEQLESALGTKIDWSKYDYDAAAGIVRRK
jgi:hypothetical protein